MKSGNTHAPATWRRIAVALSLTSASSSSGCAKHESSPGSSGVEEAAVRSDDGSPAAEQQAATDAAIVPAPASGQEDDVAATVTLLEPGTPPRRKLRYAWTAGLKEELTMDLRTLASTEVGDARTPGIALPRIQFVIIIDGLDVSADDDLHYRWRVTGAEVFAEPETPDQVAGAMRAEVGAVAHLSGDGVTSALGIARSVSIDPGSVTIDSGTLEMVEQIDQTLRTAPAPFPQEAVGPGARWERICQVASKDARITQTDTFLLVGLTGNRGALDDVLAQTAPPQNLRTPGMRAGDQARMESMLVSASAKTRFDLTRFIPQTQIESTTTMVVSGHPTGAASERTTLVLRVDIALAGTPR
jgi:hypothetical protein